MIVSHREITHPNSLFNSSSSCLPSCSGDIRWSTQDFIDAHKAVKESGKFNFEGCRIPIPTAIRYDRMEAALGKEATPKELRVLSLLRYGIPINCNMKYGVKKQQKNHFSAISHKDAINEYICKK